MKKVFVVIPAVLSLICLLAWECVQAGEVQKKNADAGAVRLKSRTFVPAQGLDQELLKYIQIGKKEKRDRVHALVQFFAVPDINERKRLEKDVKLHILDPIPERAYYVSIPTNISVARELVEKRRVRWIGYIRPKDKVAPWILDKGVPEHARRDKKRADLITEQSPAHRCRRRPSRAAPLSWKNGTKRHAPTQDLPRIS